MILPVQLMKESIVLYRTVLVGVVRYLLVGKVLFLIQNPLLIHQVFFSLNVRIETKIYSILVRYTDLQINDFGIPKSKVQSLLKPFFRNWMIFLLRFQYKN